MFISLNVSQMGYGASLEYNSTQLQKMRYILVLIWKIIVLIIKWEKAWQKVFT